MPSNILGEKSSKFMGKHNPGKPSVSSTFRRTFVGKFMPPCLGDQDPALNRRSIFNTSVSLKKNYDGFELQTPKNKIEEGKEWEFDNSEWEISFDRPQ